MIKLEDVLTDEEIRRLSNETRGTFAWVRACIALAVEKARRAHGPMGPHSLPIQIVDEDGCCPICGIDAIICAWHQGTTIAERVGTQDAGRRGGEA